MKKFVSFGSIKQFKQILKDLIHEVRWNGLDENGEVIYNYEKELPKLEVTLGEKIHGTNSSVCFNNGDFWIQSRNNIITAVGNDNAGCASFCETRETEWMEIIETLTKHYDIDTEKYIVSVFFEWAGGSIQKNSALSGLDKKAIIFRHFKVTSIERDENAEPKEVRWLSTLGVDNSEVEIYNIANLLTQKLTIDFNKPDEAEEIMNNWITEIEESSKVGEFFGIKGNIGEGFVGEFWFNDTLHRFKIKGDKHSSVKSAKVKKDKTIDPEKQKKIIDFVNTIACPGWRMEQFLVEIKNEKGDLEPKFIGEYIKRIMQDILKEESENLKEQNLTLKDIQSVVAKVARETFLSNIDKF